MTVFVYCVICERADGKQMFVFNSRKAAEKMCGALRAEGADPWIVERSVYGEEFVSFYTRES